MKNTVKLLVALILALCLVLAFASCRGDEDDEWQETMPPTNNQNQDGGNTDDSNGGLTNEGVLPGDGWGGIVFG